MDERSKLISKLQQSFETRAAYIKAKLGTLVPSQIRALRLQSEMPRQADLASAANMQQSRISMFETPGAANMTLETLAKLAAAFKVGVIVKFVPFSDLLGWENGYSQDSFHVTPIDLDYAFISPEPVASNLELSQMAAAAGIGGNSLASRRKDPASVQEGGGSGLLQVCYSGISRKENELGGIRNER